MARSETTRYAFNRGLVSPLALGRVDLKRTALSAETQNNWMPRALGSMMLRPGLKWIGATLSNAAARFVEFVRSITAMHLLEFTNAAMRVWTSDALVTRAAVSTAVANGNFDSNLTSWTDADESGATSVWVTGGYMGLTGNGTAAAIRDQTLSVGAPDQNVEHALRIVVQRGPVMLRVGSSAAGTDELINEVMLGTGTHSLAFTPTGANAYVRFFSRLKRIVLVNSCNIEAAGVVSVTSPWLAADLDNIRANTESLSVDVMFAACVGYQQRRIERRASGRSWSVILYQPEDGPFRSPNTGTGTMTSSVLSGNGTLTSSVPFFRSTHVGALFTVSSSGQSVSASVTAQNTFTNAVRVTGVGDARSLAFIISGLTGTGTTVTTQRSTESSTGPWVDYVTGTTLDGTGTYLDGLDNQIVYYRIGVKTGDYSSGTVLLTLNFSLGSIRGVGRVTAFTSNLVVDMEVLTEFGSITASDNWSEGLWSDYRGWPSAGTLYEGRLVWGGFDQIVASVSDAFDVFDPDTVGDSGPINRTIGSGPMDTINWILPLQRLILGAQLAEHSVRTTALDEPLTPSNFNRKPCSGQGSTNVQGVKIDSRGTYVQRGGSRVFELEFDPEGFDYHSVDLTILNPEVCQPRVVRMAVQRRPDTRLHCVLSDGTVAALVYDHAEKVTCWVKVDTTGAGGLVEDVVVLPGQSNSFEDQVYYVVKRTIKGATVRYLEKWALESECIGETLNKQADAFSVFTNGSPSTAVSASQLAGCEVIVWQDGVCPTDDAGDIRVFQADPSGNIVLDTAATTGVVGLAYTATYQTAKLGAQLGKFKSVDHWAPVLANTHARGLEAGPDFDDGHMDNLPLVVGGAVADTDTVYEQYDDAPQEFPGTWSVDARICLRASAPRPCTVLALSIEGQVGT